MTDTPLPELVEKFRVCSTFARRLRALHAPPVVLRAQDRAAGHYRRELARRGMTTARIKALEQADLSTRDVIGPKLADALEAAFDAAVIQQDPALCAQAADRLRELGLSEEDVRGLTDLNGFST